MSFLASLREELKLFLFDKWLLISFIIVPFFLAFYIFLVFGSGQVKNIPIGVVDLDKSTYSKELTGMINDTLTLDVNADFLSYNEALKDLQNNKIYAILVIPNNFQKDFKKGFSNKIHLFYNAQFILIGRSINSSVNLSVETYNTKLKAIRYISKGNTKIENAINNSRPIKMQIVALYNQSLNYSKFLLTAILPAIWQIVIISSLVLNLSAQHNKTGILNWIKQSGFKGFVAKLFVHQIVMMTLYLCFMNYFIFVKQWFSVEQFTILFFSAWLCVFASQAMGCLFFFLSLQPAKALSLTAVFSAPSLAFMGITFPLSDMNIFAQVWSSLIPISHYIKIQIALTNYKFLSNEYLHYLFNYFFYIVAFCLVILIIRVLLKKEESK